MYFSHFLVFFVHKETIRGRLYDCFISFLLSIFHRHTVRLLEGANVPADGAEGALLEAGLLFGYAVDFSEDGPSQQDVDPGVQDLIPGGHSDASHHEFAVSAGEFLAQAGFAVGARG